MSELRRAGELGGCELGKPDKGRSGESWVSRDTLFSLGTGSLASRLFLSSYRGYIFSGSALSMYLLNVHTVVCTGLTYIFCGMYYVPYILITTFGPI